MSLAYLYGKSRHRGCKAFVAGGVQVGCRSGQTCWFHRLSLIQLVCCLQERRDLFKFKQYILMTRVFSDPLLQEQQQQQQDGAAGSSKGKPPAGPGKPPKGPHQQPAKKQKQQQQVRRGGGCNGGGVVACMV